MFTDFFIKLSSLFHLVTYLISSNYYYYNPHMHKMGPQGSKHYIFGDRFYSKNARKLKCYASLHFNARKHMM